MLYVCSFKKIICIVSLEKTIHLTQISTNVTHLDCQPTISILLTSVTVMLTAQTLKDHITAAVRKVTMETGKIVKVINIFKTLAFLAK